MTHAMNNVYAAVLKGKNYFMNKDKYLVDNLYFAEMTNLEALMYRRILIGVRIALSKDTSKNVKPAYKDFLTKIVSTPNTEPASALS